MIAIVFGEELFTMFRRGRQEVKISWKSLNRRKSIFGTTSVNERIICEFSTPSRFVRRDDAPPTGPDYPAHLNSNSSRSMFTYDSNIEKQTRVVVAHEEDDDDQ